MLSGTAMKPLSEYLYYSNDQGRPCIDSQATAIKNATLVSFVGKQFLKEIIEDHFPDHRIIPESVRSEVKAKYYSGSALAIQNAPSPMIHPERCEGLACNFGVDDDVIRAKKENLVEFQKRTGLNVNPDAILLYWPSRLDPVQKGVHLLEEIAQRFVIEHGDAQIAIVGNGVDGDAAHEKICGQIAWASGGKIAYQRFDESLSRLGFAAASDTFGASLYEPCGQIDQIGNLYGTTSTNRDTGGYHDKILEISRNGNGNYRDSGNGFLFRDYDAGGLWYGLERSVQFHRQPLEIKERHIKRIMREARQQHNLDGMIDGYIEAYERLNGGNPLI
jgi:glycogen synthase